MFFILTMMTIIIISGFVASFFDRTDYTSSGYDFNSKDTHSKGSTYREDTPVDKDKYVW